jgi:hypothetical protein
MDSQNYIEYELSDPVSGGKEIFTRSYDEALAYFDRGWIVVEKNITICRPSVFLSTRLTAVMTWNNNPDFEKGD